MGEDFGKNQNLYGRKTEFHFFKFFFFSIHLDPISSHLLMIMKEEIFRIKTEV